MRIFAGSVTAAAASMALLALSIAAAEAQRRPDVRTMTCGQARALVWQSGAIVLTTGRHTYDRYVADERFCAAWEIGERAYANTSDAQSCFIGYVCVPGSRWDRFPWLEQWD